VRSVRITTDTSTVRGTDTMTTTYAPHVARVHTGTDRDAMARAYLATFGRPMPGDFDVRIPARGTDSAR
jgi:hypothetical protein